MSDKEIERRKGLSFLQAEGLRPLPQIQEGHNLTAAFRAQVFEIIKEACQYDGGGYGGSRPGEKTKQAWTEYFGFFADDLPIYDTELYKRFRKLLDTDSKWLDFLQYLVRKRFLDRDQFRRLDELLKIEMIGFRLIGSHQDGAATLMPVSDQAEADANQGDYEELSGYSKAREHFRTAVDRLKSSDWRGSISESIHGVESVAKKVSGNDHAVLDALKVVERRTPLNPALSKGLNAIYGWTSQDDGIRHAMSDQAQKVDEPEARFMLSACLAFAAWLKRSSMGL
jgi:hypothetical protein